MCYQRLENALRLPAVQDHDDKRRHHKYEQDVLLRFRQRAESVGIKGLAGRFGRTDSTRVYTTKFSSILKYR